MGIESGKMGNEYPNINLVIQMLEKPRSIYIVTLHPSPLQIFIILTYSIPMFSKANKQASSIYAVDQEYIYTKKQQEDMNFTWPTFPLMKMLLHFKSL